jgi:hypothetical protein
MENQSEILLNTADDGKTKLQVRLMDETFWLNQQQIALLFGKSRVTITEIGHLFFDYRQFVLKIFVFLIIIN